jgi:hypothetical protein
MSIFLFEKKDMCYIDTQVVEKSEVRVLIVRRQRICGNIQPQNKKDKYETTESVMSWFGTIGVSPDSPRHTRNGRTSQRSDRCLEFRRSDVLCATT